MIANFLSPNQLKYEPELGPARRQYVQDLHARFKVVEDANDRPLEAYYFGNSSHYYRSVKGLVRIVIEATDSGIAFRQQYRLHSGAEWISKPMYWLGTGTPKQLLIEHMTACLDVDDKPQNNRPAEIRERFEQLWKGIQITANQQYPNALVNLNEEMTALDVIAYPSAPYASRYVITPDGILETTFRRSTVKQPYLQLGMSYLSDALNTDYYVRSAIKGLLDLEIDNH